MGEEMGPRKAKKATSPSRTGSTSSMDYTKKRRRIKAT
jgi:hypothetical protein